MAGARLTSTGVFQIATGPGGFASTQSTTCTRKKPPKGPPLGNRITYKRDQLLNWLANAGSAVSKLLSRQSEMEEGLLIAREQALTNMTFFDSLTAAQRSALERAIANGRLGEFQMHMGKIVEQAYATELRTVFPQSFRYVSESAASSAFDYTITIEGTVFQVDLTAGSYGSYLSHMARTPIDILIQYSSLTWAEMVRVGTLLGVTIL